METSIKFFFFTIIFRLPLTEVHGVWFMQSCDASILLVNANGIVSELGSDRNFGMRNFKYINTIKSALESECPETVSCADIVALSAREGVIMVTLLHNFY